MAKPSGWLGIVLLITIFLLQTKNGVHYGSAALCLAGALYFARNFRRQISEPYFRDIVLIFFAIWIPMLLSSAFAIEKQHAFETTISYLHFFPLAIVAAAFAFEHEQRWFMTLLATLIAFWVADALIQLVFAVDVFGYVYEGGPLLGAFYPRQRLGLVVAALSPFYLWLMWQMFGHWAPRGLSVFPVLIVLLFSLKRSGWLMFAIVLTIFLAAIAEHRKDRRSALKEVAMIVGVIAITAGVLATDDRLGQRMGSVSDIVSGAPNIDEASGYRLSLWRTAGAMFADNPILGVGPRGFRHVYERYASDSDFWSERGQTHPHLFIAEVAAESGGLGLLGYLIASGLILRIFLTTRASATTAARSAILAALVCWLPVNSHMAFYGSYWATLCWITVALGVGGCRSTGTSS
ncbi:MAG: O-antigen ligase family protein [Pseudomonadota bacterium]